MGSGNQGYYRGSVLDLTNLQYSSYVIDTSSSIFGNGTFNASTKDYGFGALSADEMSQLRTWTNYKNVVFDITFEGTSAALYNGGVGAFTFGSGTAHEWGMPGGRTTGFLTVNGSKIEIDTKRSFTWYDRQWGAAMGNWTWFQLNFNNGTAKASFWAIDTTTPYQRARFATVRTADGIHHFLPTMLTPNTEHTYLSNATDIEYPLQWDLKIGETDHLTIKSVRADQEIVGSAISDSAYEGFVMFLGTLLNKCKDLGWLRWSKLCSE
ncbi:MAG: hypothetical protein M1834_001420 [Cirrosporium novae-zelandiae]|nr:MAG: hypothetical protein M1834_001420 [Cirrosporium novae-zelandiae]